MKHSRFLGRQIISLLKEVEEGVPITEQCREHGMSSALPVVFGLVEYRKGDYLVGETL